MEANELSEAIRDGIREGIKEKFKSSYGPFFNNLNKFIEAECETALRDALKAALADRVFQIELEVAVRASLGKQLVGAFDRDLQRHVNALKSDPKIRQQVVDALGAIATQNHSPVQPVQGAGDAQSA